MVFLSKYFGEISKGIQYIRVNTFILKNFIQTFSKEFNVTSYSTLLLGGILNSAFPSVPNAYLGLKNNFDFSPFLNFFKAISIPSTTPASQASPT